jgi:23S rRNA (pseudouridine1915-N3)-methyltransferase
VKDVVGRGSTELALQKEAEALLKAAPEARYRVALDVTGQAYTSPALSQWLQKKVEQHGHLAFLLGGPEGLAPKVLQNTDEVLSLSALTLPHEMARIVLLEQLYRAMTLLGGEHYHK